MSDRSNHDRLRRVEHEVEILLADVRDQVQRLRTTVDRMRALRGRPDEDADPLARYGSRSRGRDSAGGGGFGDGSGGRARFSDPG